VLLQHLDATCCADILNGSILSIRERRVQVTVPSGIFTVLDIEHRQAGRNLFCGRASAGQRSINGR
jgi:hypothetical protein